ncbi:MAG TPA: GIY-YIG nuclease family protein [Chthoniobacteraceae bacterium]|nr:GIY-YIG nuclease family protein [Chthoniobacteraceae bacterium]
MKTYYVYIMTNKTRTTIYIGVTGDLATRVDQHQRAESKGFTKAYRLNRLVYYETFNDVHDAIAREKQLKGWRREKKNALIATQNPLWADLSHDLI